MLMVFPFLVILLRPTSLSAKTGNLNPRALARAESDRFAYHCDGVHGDEVRPAAEAYRKYSPSVGELRGSAGLAQDLA
jgi:hypothetical protein